MAEEHPSKAYELMEWIADYPDSISPLGKAPEHLRQWYVYLVEHGLVTDDPILGGPNGLGVMLSGIGKVALLLNKPEHERSKAATVKNKLSLDERALALWLNRRELTKKEMAKNLNCHEKSLAPKRCPKLDTAITAYAEKEVLPRGSKDANGNLEA